MNIRYLLLTLLTFFIVFQSCSSDPSVNIKLLNNPQSLKQIDIKIDLTPLKQLGAVNDPDEKSFLKLSQVIDTIEYIPLENTGSSGIGSIDRIILSDSTLFILDSFHSKGVFSFTREGKALLSIERRGKGPGEIEFPVDLLFNKNKQEIEVLDINLRKTVRYNSKTGEFITEVYHEFQAKAFTLIMQGKYYLYYLGDIPQYSSTFTDYVLVVVDTTGNVVGKMLSKNVLVSQQGLLKSRPLNTPSVFFDVSKNIKSFLGTDVIYYIFGADSIVPRYYLNINGKGSVFSNVVPEQNNNSFIESFFEYKNLIFFDLTYRGVTTFGFIDTTRDYALASYLIINDIDGMPLPKILTLWKGYLVGYIDPYDFLDKLENLPLLPINTKQRLSKLTGESNPVIVLYKLKENFK
jgi:hypothetical protein